MASAVEASGNFPEIFIKPDSNDVISQSARPHLESFALSKPSRAFGLRLPWKSFLPAPGDVFASCFPPSRSYILRPRISVLDRLAKYSPLDPRAHRSYAVPYFTLYSKFYLKRATSSRAQPAVISGPPRQHSSAKFVELLEI